LALGRPLPGLDDLPHHRLRSRVGDDRQVRVAARSARRSRDCQRHPQHSRTTSIRFIHTPYQCTFSTGVMEIRGGAGRRQGATVSQWVTATLGPAASRAARNLRAVSGKALVTGGAGFIGSHLCERLLEDGWEVYALDDLSTGSIRNVEHLTARSDFHLVVDSVLKPAVVNELVHKCDVVYHLAAAVGVRLIVEQPVHTIVTNLEGTEVVLDHCSRFGKRVLVASTSEVYGDPRTEEPFGEDDRRVYGPTTQK